MYRYIYWMQNAQPVPHFAMYIKNGLKSSRFSRFLCHPSTLMCMNMQQFSCSSSGNAVCCCQCNSRRVNWIFCVTLVSLSSIMLTRDPLRTIKVNLNFCWRLPKTCRVRSIMWKLRNSTYTLCSTASETERKKLCARCPRFWPVKIRYGRFCPLIPSVWLLIT